MHREVEVNDEIKRERKGNPRWSQKMISKDGLEEKGKASDLKQGEYENRYRDTDTDKTKDHYPTGHTSDTYNPPPAAHRQVNSP